MPSIINRRGRPPHPDILTPAEWQVLEGVRAGRTNQEIAAGLGITFHTVKYHISNMLGKLHLEDHQQLAAWRPQRRERPVRHWRVLAPLGALKVAGTVTGGAMVAIGLGGASILAIRGLNADEPPRASHEPTPQAAIERVVAQPTPSDALVMLPQSSPRVVAEFTSLGRARTGLRITIQLDQPLPARTVPAARDVLITAYTPSGERTISGGGGDYPSDPQGRASVWTIEIEADPLPPGTVALAVTIGRMEFISAQQPPLPPEPLGPWIAVLHLADAPVSRDLTNTVQREIDTGFGWLYVIDGVGLTGNTLAVTYHAEGDIETLRSWPLPDPELMRRTAVFLGGRPATLEMEVPPGARR